jgi:hypothetical protein
MRFIRTEEYLKIVDKSEDGIYDQVNELRKNSPEHINHKIVVHPKKVDESYVARVEVIRLPISHNQSSKRENKNKSIIDIYDPNTALELFVKFGRQEAEEYLEINDSEIQLEDKLNLKISSKDELLSRIGEKGLFETANEYKIPPDYIFNFHDIKLPELQDFFGFARIRPNAQYSLEEKVMVERGYLSNLRKRGLL